ncbi:orn/DAP/Arg decarboxylase 2 [Micromonospora sp. ATCC 39149]|uniref:Type III PLP-dependent enzyme n=1 Tax=Micromonospora carbonacea TaxID=47853 RepID=A0A7D6CFM0_9ACTN|nr:orn/DAP/Arg decarboxylase 2 [Micromonospora sp. ATCC 39149]EEP71448.1 orn/DAP/Arg decarboxylase 2 [Micromonospora sp. ATCC 39149]QLJ97711.1 type III PLP-dependent enzyme [Micromonospora carbonacea]
MDERVREALVTAYGSPLYVYDLDRIDQAHADLRAALPTPSTLLYSMKANPHPVIARRLRLAGCRLEVSSAGELAAALLAGAGGGDLLYTGPAKTPAELEEAVAAGVRAFSVESFSELQRLGRAAAGQDADLTALLRVNGPGAAGGSGLRMTGTASQFGIDAGTLATEWSPDRVPDRVRVTGLHLFPITNARGEDQLLDELRAAVDTAAELARVCRLDPAVVDLGGGFSAPYAAPGSRPVYQRLRAEAETRLDAAFPGWRAGRPEVMFESGRYLVAECGTLLTTVVDVKHTRGRTYAVLDAGINVLGGMTGLGRLLPMRALPVGSAETASDVTRVDLAGPSCTPLDVLGRDVPLPEARSGTVLAIPNVGAYGLSASLVGFLSRPMPAEVLLSGGRVVASSRPELRHVHATFGEGGPDDRGHAG